jgi:MFS family permease
MSILRAIQSLGRNILQPVWGRLSDKYGKKRFIALGRSLYGGFSAGITLLSDALVDHYTLSGHRSLVVNY